MAHHLIPQRVCLHFGYNSHRASWFLTYDLGKGKRPHSRGGFKSDQRVDRREDFAVYDTYSFEDDFSDDYNQFDDDYFDEFGDGDNGGDEYQKHLIKEMFWADDIERRGG